MALCVQTPIQTLFETITSTEGSVSTSTSIEVVTQPATVSTIVTTVCLDVVNGTCVSSTVSSSLQTIPGQVITSTILTPITQDVFVTETLPTQTIFTSDCGGDASQPTSSSSTTEPTSNPAQPTTPTTRQETTSEQQQQTESISQSLGTPTIFTTIVLVTGHNGAVSTSTAVATTTPTINVPVDINSGQTKTHLAPIIGAVVGGILGVGLLAIFFWLWWRKRNTRWDDIFDVDDGEDRYRDDPPRRDMLNAEVEPKPYEYGMVGATRPPSNPQSPDLQPAVGHGRTASMTPLILGPSEGYPPARTSAELGGTLMSGYPPPVQGMNVQPGPAGAGSRRSSLVSGGTEWPGTPFSRDGTATSIAASTAPLITGHARAHSVGGPPTAWVPPPTEDGMLPPAYSQLAPSGHSVSPTSPSGSSAGPSSFVVRDQKPRPQSAQYPSSSTAASSFSSAPAAITQPLSIVKRGQPSPPIQVGSSTRPTYPPHPISMPPGKGAPPQQTSPVSRSTPSIYSRDSVDEMNSLNSGMRLALANPDSIAPGDQARQQSGKRKN